MKKVSTKLIIPIFALALSVSCSNNSGNKNDSSQTNEVKTEEVSINPRDYVKVTGENGHYWMSIQVKNISSQKVKRVEVKYRINNGKVQREVFTNIAPNETKSANVMQTMGSSNYSLSFDDVKISL